ncbi:MAG: ABC transporter permease [Verrucomicrobiae bacterium]|nr:ABC transporter permease [Verrucomicrobiae bacterium]
MRRRLIIRVVLAIPTLFAVVCLTFFLMRLAPGGPFDREKAIPESIKRQLMAQYQLDGPVLTQLYYYLKDVARGDLRLSTKYRNRTVNEIISQTLPISACLGGIAFFLALGGGCFFGIWAAYRHNRPSDSILMFLALLGIALPSFVIGPLLIVLFSFKLGWLPVGGWGTVQQVFLPALALSLPYMAYLARMVRVSMLETLNQDYIRTARAKGLAEWRVLYVHALKNAALPVVSYSGPLAANILTGSLVVEEIFKIPGIGPFFVNGVLNRDVFVVGGITLVYSMLLIAFNLVVDLFYGLLDKRIQSA